MIAARQIFLGRGGTGGGGWVNPYVTDGLIHMWDVEASYGGGEIQDYMGGPPIVLDPSCELIGSNMISFTSTAAISFSDSTGWGGITEGISDLPLAGTPTTSECVWKSDGLGTGWSDYRYAFSFCNGAVLNYNNRPTICIPGYRNSETSFRIYGKFMIIGASDPELTDLVSMSGYAETWSVIHGYRNLVELDSQTNTGSEYCRKDTRVSILGSTIVGAVIKFGCLRIYNRSLSDDEIAANYAVDKARFNLPTT